MWGVQRTELNLKDLKFRLPCKALLCATGLYMVHRVDALCTWSVDVVDTPL